MNLTVRNIPDEIINKIRTLSKVEKRSLNNEMLIVLERGVEDEINHLFNLKRRINKNTQVEIWRKLAQEWKDNRSTSEIINDIYSSRTVGREFKL